MPIFFQHLILAVVSASVTALVGWYLTRMLGRVETLVNGRLDQALERIAELEAQLDPQDAQ